MSLVVRLYIEMCPVFSSHVNWHLSVSKEGEAAIGTNKRCQQHSFESRKQLFSNGTNLVIVPGDVSSLFVVYCDESDASRMSY